MSDDGEAQAGASAPGAEGEAPKRRGKGPQKIVAEILAERQFSRADQRFMAGYVQGPDGVLYEYDGRVWKPLSEASLKALAFNFLPGARAAMVREIVDMLKVSVHERDLRFGRVADHEVALRNVVVDVRNGATRAHVPEDYLDSVIPWDWEPAAPCPRWRQCLIDFFGDTDDGRERALQEMFGYVLLSHAKFKKAGLLHGPSDSGKSMVILLLREMVGPEATCSLSVEDMDDPVRMSVILHKRLNVMTELPSEALIRDGGFKTLISTEEPVLIDRKYHDVIMYTPTAKHVIATNNLPRVTDRSEGTLNRLHIVRFTEVIAKDQQDKHLLAALVGEMPGIVAWAVEGAKRLIERRGEFTTLESSRELLAELREDANPFIAFRDECLAEDQPNGALAGSAVAKAFNLWKGGGRSASVRAVGKMARDAGMSWGPIYLGDPGAQQRKAKGLRGWRLLTEEERRVVNVEPGLPDP